MRLGWWKNLELPISFLTPLVALHICTVCLLTLGRWILNNAPAGLVGMYCSSARKPWCFFPLWKSKGWEPTNHPEPNLHDYLGGGLKYFFMFIPIWRRFPLWLIFFRWVETTNQSMIMVQPWIFRGVRHCGQRKIPSNETALFPSCGVALAG